MLPGLPVAGSTEVKSASAAAESGERVYAHQMVRTDCRAQKLDAFLRPKEKPAATAADEAAAAGPSDQEAATRTIQAEDEQMDETGDVEMLEALNELETEAGKVAEDDVNGAQRYGTRRAPITPQRQQV